MPSGVTGSGRYTGDISKRPVTNFDPIAAIRARIDENLTVADVARRVEVAYSQVNKFFRWFQARGLSLQEALQEELKRQEEIQLAEEAERKADELRVKRMIEFKARRFQFDEDAINAINQDIAAKEQRVIRPQTEPPPPPPKLLQTRAFPYHVSILKRLPLQERRRFFDSLSEEEAEALYFDWKFFARLEQLPPDKAWTFWLIQAGRGFGKTRSGAELVRRWIRDGYRYVNLAGATADDARDIMICGESGILAICPKDERPVYKKSDKQLVWPNGAISLILTADEPERFRGKQSDKGWVDELAAWRYPEAWAQFKLGLRLGDNPQCVITTTPRPVLVIRELVQDKACIVTRGTTYDNRENLAPSFYRSIITMYEGTRLGRQELNAELLDDNPGALFTLENIERNRLVKIPDGAGIDRIVVAIDPAATSKPDSDETGIVAVARDRSSPPHFYILDDKSGIMSPDRWAKTAIDLYHAWKADRMIGETNNGGDMIETLLRNIDENVSYKKVTATRGKVIRAEPIGAIYEQNRVHHIGVLSKLEDQMCAFNPSTYRPGTDKSPDRMDALVWAMTELADGFLGHGLVRFMQRLAGDESMMDQLTSSPMGQAMEKVQSSSSLSKPAVNDQTTRCPKCEATAIARIGAELKCNQCGHQWGAQIAQQSSFGGMSFATLAKMQSGARRF